jgi:Flp pilus assembly protein TadG
MINNHKQKGAETVEFAMIALLLFAMLFAIIEFSRALFVWNALTEATRRGARMAVVCPYQSTIPAKVAIFDVINGSLGTSPIIGGLTTGMVKVRYLNAAGGNETNQTLIKFTEVSIDVSPTTGYKHTLLIPLWGGSLTFSPATVAFTTTLPTESLGAVPTYPPILSPPPNCVF